MNFTLKEDFSQKTPRNNLKTLTYIPMYPSRRGESGRNLGSKSYCMSRKVVIQEVLLVTAGLLISPVNMKLVKLVWSLVCLLSLNEAHEDRNNVMSNRS